MEDRISELALVRNYRNGGGRWETFIAPYGDTRAMQEAVREHNKQVVAESLKDASEALAGYFGPFERRAEQLVSLATFLASKRVVTVDRVVDEWLNLKVWEARQNGNGDVQQY